MICLYLIFYRFWSTCEKDWPSLVNKKLLKENLINQFLAELFWEEQKLLQNVFYDRKKWTYFFTSKYGLLKKLLKGKWVLFEFLQRNYFIGLNLSLNCDTLIKMQHLVNVAYFKCSNRGWGEKNVLSCFWFVISWLLFTLELLHDYANWSIHELIHHVWLSIRLDNLIACRKTNQSKKLLAYCNTSGLSTKLATWFSRDRIVAGLWRPFVFFAEAAK